MEEIGGYFELEHFYGAELHEDAYSFNYCRYALEALLIALKTKIIWLPYYICDSVKAVCEKNKIRICWYHINEKMRPIFQKEMKKNDVILLVNYFGVLEESEIFQIKKKFPNIILDNTQAFFLKLPSSINALYSCRKFIGVPDGAYLYTEVCMEQEYKESMSGQTMDYFMGRYEETASLHFEQFQKHEKAVENEAISRMSKLTHNLLRAVDYQKIATIRNENFAFLKKHLDGIGMFTQSCKNVPFMYPLLLESRKAELVRKRLLDNRIYVPILWKEVLDRNGASEWEQNLSLNLLPIPCDQRYSIRHMEKIVNIILNIINREE